MKKPGFFEGIAVALIAAVIAEVSFTVLPWLMSRWAAYFLTISLLSLGYLTYWSYRSPRKTGRPTLLVLWALSSLGAALLEVSPPFYLLLQLGFVWLIRSLYLRNGIFGALADLVWLALAVGSAAWAYSRSGSVFLCVWSFFLVEALVLLRPNKSLCSAEGDRMQGANPRFEQAHRNAMKALQQLTTR